MEMSTTPQAALPAWRRFLQRPAMPGIAAAVVPPGARGTEVVVAARDLDPAQPLTSADLTTVRVADQLVPPGAVSDPAALLGSRSRPLWLLGTGALALSKIIENMELGHNVMHGQWDWMNDPEIHSTTWEWDMASPAAQWKHSHNELHHTYTNVIGRDNDLGFGIARVDPDQPWKPWMVWQPLFNAVNAVTFEYSIALYDLELGRYQGKPLTAWKPAIPGLLAVGKKVAKQMGKDYVVTPALSGPNLNSPTTCVSSS